MATGNFCTMEKFDLYAYMSDRFVCRVCSECGTVCEDGSKTCEFCGGKVSDEEIYDEVAEMFFLQDLQDACDEENYNLEFFEISILPGYYQGAQLYVEELEYYCEDSFVHEEEEKVRDALQRIADTFGLMRLFVSCRFSNGEVWYSAA